MKEILKEMGGTVIAVAGTALVMLLLFQGLRIGTRSGLPAVLGGAAADTVSTREQTYAAETVLRAVYSRARPVAAGSRVRTGTLLLPKEVIMTADADGKETEIGILAITSATTGEDVTENVYDGTHLFFSASGIYEIRMRLTDEAGAGNVCHIYMEAED